MPINPNTKPLSDTPRTDKALENHCGKGKAGVLSNLYEFSDFARGLERELSEAFVTIKARDEAIQLLETGKYGRAHLTERMRLATERAERAEQSVQDFGDCLNQVSLERDNQLQAMREALQTLIPLARGYVAYNQVGNNIRMLNDAIALVNSTTPTTEQVKKEKELPSQDVKLGGDCEHGTPQGLLCSLCEVETMEKPL